MKRTVPWIHSARLDVPFILAPPFVVLGLVALFPRWFGPTAVLSEVHWLVLVLLIDVAHVYSTIYRTYLDRDAIKHYRFELVWLPAMAFILMVLLHTVSMVWFWRCLAYLAVFHFVRQQYGFLRLYARREALPSWKRRLDTITIYSATIAPLLFWHFSYPREFDWFVDDDMIGSDKPGLASVVLGCYGVVLASYVLSEVVRVCRGEGVNWPKNLLVAGTALSWYLGIVHFNGDVTFTLFNVVSHGIPYMALVWAFGRKKRERSETGSRFVRFFFSMGAVPIYVLALFVLAYLEEGLWNTLVWREHAALFGPFSMLPKINSHSILSFVVPLLALPQVTHYIIDAFIWRMRPAADKDGWRQVIFGAEPDQ